jgi:hypothetical protein
MRAGSGRSRRLTAHPPDAAPGHPWRTPRTTHPRPGHHRPYGAWPTTSGQHGAAQPQPGRHRQPQPGTAPHTRRARRQPPTADHDSGASRRTTKRIDAADPSTALLTALILFTRWQPQASRDASDRDSCLPGFHHGRVNLDCAVPGHHQALVSDQRFQSVKPVNLTAQRDQQRPLMLPELKVTLNRSPEPLSGRTATLRSPRNRHASMVPPANRERFSLGGYGAWLRGRTDPPIGQRRFDTCRRYSARGDSWRGVTAGHRHTDYLVRADAQA